MHSNDASAQDPAKNTSAVYDLAADAMLNVAKASEPNEIDANVYARLRDAAKGIEQSVFNETVEEILKDSKVNIPDLIGDYIPGIARELGEEWCADQTSFAMVTIGSARLQNLVHTLEQRSPEPYWLKGTTRPALITTPMGEHHTLGATVLLSQLRRAGIVSEMVLDLDAEGLALTLKNYPAETVLISASPSTPLADLEQLVACAKKDQQIDRDVLVGGSITQQKLDLCHLTGADAAPEDTKHVVNLCKFGKNALKNKTAQT